jgi:hypothetical protein
MAELTWQARLYEVRSSDVRYAADTQTETPVQLSSRSLPPAPVAACAMAAAAVARAPSALHAPESSFASRLGPASLFAVDLSDSAAAQLRLLRAVHAVPRGALYEARARVPATASATLPGGQCPRLAAPARSGR